MTVARDRGTWRYRTTAYYADGTSVRIHGSAPRYENTRDKALAMEAAHVARMRTLLPGQEEATEETTAGGTGEPTPRTVPTVKEFAPGYLEGCAVDLAHSTMGTKRCDFKNHILPMLGDLRLDEVTYQVLKDFKVALTKKQSANTKHQPRLLSRKSVHNLQLHVSHMLATAKESGFISSVPKIEWIEVPATEFDFLTFEEADRLVAGRRDEWRTMILMGLRTGMRRGELLGLRWSDVDLEAGKLMVRQAFVKGRFTSPKSGKPRPIPLGDEMRAELRIHRHTRGPLVFCDDVGQPWTEGSTASPLLWATKRAGLREIGWHTLRHTFASHLVMKAVPLKVVQELLGHSSIETTMIYAHLAPDFVRDSVTVLDRPMAAGVGPAGAPALVAERSGAWAARLAAENPAPNIERGSIPVEVAKDRRNAPEDPATN